MHEPEPIDLVVDLAVRTLTARYCDAVARFDADQFASLWAADAAWVVPGVATTVGRERIARLFAKLRQGFVLCTQELMSGFVAPSRGSAGEARARWQIREVQWRSDAPPSCVMGLYTDRLVADDDGAWRFAERRFDVVYRGPVDLGADPIPLPDDLPVL